MKKSTNIFQHLRIKAQLKFYQFRLEALVYGIALLYGLLVGRFVSTLVLLVSFNLIRPETPVTFHFDNVNTCVKVSVCMFLVSITQLLGVPENVTMCYGIIIGLAICLILYKIEYSRIRAIDFKNCTKEQVVEVCNTLGYNKFKQDLAVMFFVDKLSNKEVWEILCSTQRNVEWDTVKKYKYRITKDFKSVIKDKE